MKKLFPVLLLLFCLHSAAQQISSKRWTDLFSYNNVLAIRDDGNRLVAATENGLFFYTPQTGEISKLSKTNGLHEVTISAFDFNGETGYGLIGYKSGTLDVITPEGITYVVDIPLATGYTGDKKINHIFISGKTAVISSGYGVSLFNLEKKEFGESAFFANGAGFDEAKKAAILGETVYVITANGIKTKGFDEETKNFPLYSSWENLETGTGSPITSITAGAETLFYSDTNTVFAEGGAAPIGSFDGIKDLVVTGEAIIVVDKNSVSAFNHEGLPIKDQEFSSFLNTGYYKSGKLYGGSDRDGLKVIAMDEKEKSIKPDGPYNNVSYKLDIVQDKIVVSTGGRDGYNTPTNNGNLGYYLFDGASWQYPDMFKTGSWNILDAVINPQKTEEIFFVNFVFNANSKGIYRVENGELKNVFKTGTDLYNRVAGLTFDSNNQLFVSGSQDKVGFYLYNRPNDMYRFVPIVAGGDAQKPFAQDGMLFIPAPYKDPGGAIIYDYKNTPEQISDDQYIFVNKEKLNNLPLGGTVSLALDKNADLWIGTRSGLRVLSNPKAAVASQSVTTEPIMIEENGVGEELFRDTEILQIAVDNGNQKWVSTEGGGVFYLSADGTQTKLHFTKENSPLPTNSATDIKIDPKTGKVYFATLDGIVVYQGDVLEVTENFGDVLVYPNPVVHAQFKGNVKIRGLAAKTNIRITDAAGNLVHQAIARGGSYEWNLLSGRGTRVASGVYFVLMTNEDGTDTATAKIAVVN